MGRVQGAERQRRHLGAVLEEDVAVKVHVARHRRPLVRAEGRELPRLVRLLGERDVLLPDRAGDLRRHQRLDRRPAHQNPDAVLEDALHFLRCGLVRIDSQRLRRGQLADRGRRVVRELDHADVLGVVGDARPIERRVDLDLVAQRVLDGLALEVLVGVARIGEAVPDEPGIERPARVDVRLAEIGLAVGVLRLGEGRGRGQREPADGEQRAVQVRMAKTTSTCCSASQAPRSSSGNSDEIINFSAHLSRFNFGRTNASRGRRVPPHREAVPATRPRNAHASSRTCGFSPRRDDPRSMRPSRPPRPLHRLEFARESTTRRRRRASRTRTRSDPPTLPGFTPMSARANCGPKALASSSNERSP